jgi:hypothetical protein
MICFAKTEDFVNCAKERILNNIPYNSIHKRQTHVTARVQLQKKKSLVVSLKGLGTKTN